MHSTGAYGLARPPLEVQWLHHCPTVLWSGVRAMGNYSQATCKTRIRVLLDSACHQPKFVAECKRCRLGAVFNTPGVGIQSRPTDACANCSGGRMAAAFMDITRCCHFQLIG